MKRENLVGYFLSISKYNLLGLASSPYVTSTVILSVSQSVSQTRFSYFPSLDFSDFLHQVSLHYINKSDEARFSNIWG